MKSSSLLVLMIPFLILPLFVIASNSGQKSIENLLQSEADTGNWRGNYYLMDVGNFVNTISDVGYSGNPYWPGGFEEGGYTLLEYLPGEWPKGSGVFYLHQSSLVIGYIVSDTERVASATNSDFFNFTHTPLSRSSGTSIKSMYDLCFSYDDRVKTWANIPMGWEVSERVMAWSYDEYDDFQISLYEITKSSDSTIHDVFVAIEVRADCGEYLRDQLNLNLINMDYRMKDDLVDYDGWTPNNENAWEYDWVDPLDLDGDGVTGYDYWGWPIADPNNPYWDGYVDDYAPSSPIPEPDGIYDEYQIFLMDDGPIIRYQLDLPDRAVLEGDPIVTSKGDTLRGYLISRNASYMMDGDSDFTSKQDFGERFSRPTANGVIGTRFLYVPIEPFYIEEEDSLPRPYSHVWWNLNSWPGYPELWRNTSKKYRYMSGNNEMNDGMLFMPHPFDYKAGAPVFDYTYMQSYGPYESWEKGETKKFVVATGMGWGLQGFRENIDNAMQFYYMGNPEVIGDPVAVVRTPEKFGEQLGFTGASDADIVFDRHFTKINPPLEPNLVYNAGDKYVDLFWDTAAESYEDVFVGGVDFWGYKVYRSGWNLDNWELIAAFDILDEDVYLVTTEGDTVNPILVAGDTLTAYDEEYDEIKSNYQRGTDWDYLLINLPGTSLSDIVHQYRDDGGDFRGENGEIIFSGIDTPVNGQDYYYTVVSYDSDKTDIPSVESSKTNYTTDPETKNPVASSPSSTSVGAGDVSQVRVVPNPYKGSAEFEQKYESRITFINLPPQCRLSVFSLTGDLIKEFTKSDALSGTIIWDLVSRKNQQIKSGLYLYTVETPEGNKSIGKFLVIR